MSIYRSDPTIDFWQALAFEIEAWRADQDFMLGNWAERERYRIKKRASVAHEAIEKSYQYARAYVTLSPIIRITMDAERLIRTFASLTEATERAANSFKGFGAAMGANMRHLGIPLARPSNIEEVER